MFPHSRSREGAWIEITLGLAFLSISSVAPVRERGLKSDGSQLAGLVERSLP